VKYASMYSLVVNRTSVAAKQEHGLSPQILEPSYNTTINSMVCA